MTQGLWRTALLPQAVAVDRRATAVWLPGTTVYELVAPAPECTVFTMQSFFIGRDASGVADASELPGLVESGRLVLPQGWTYRTRVLQVIPHANSLNVEYI